MNSPPSEADLPQPAAGPVRRALRRAKGVLRRHWQVQAKLSSPWGRSSSLVLLLLVPPIVVLALSADLLAFLFGGSAGLR